MKRLLSSFWFKVTLSAVLLAVLFVRTDFHDLGQAFARTHGAWLVAALIGYLVSQIVSVARWCLLARPLGFREPFGRFVDYYFNGMFLNLFVPSTVAGDVSRALLLAGQSKRRGLALTSVIADRGIGFIALVWIGAAAILLVTTYPLPSVIYWAGLVAPLASVALWWLAPLAIARFLPSEHRWRLLVERDLKPYRRDHQLLVVSLGLASVFHLIQIFSQVFVANALDLHLPWTFFLIFVPIVNIAGMLPISFSGVGVREAGYWYFLGLVGVDRELAIALGLLSSAIVIVGGLAGAPAFLRTRPQG